MQAIFTAHPAKTLLPILRQGAGEVPGEALEGFRWFWCSGGEDRPWTPLDDHLGESCKVPPLEQRGCAGIDEASLDLGHSLPKRGA